MILSLKIGLVDQCSIQQQLLTFDKNRNKSVRKLMEAYTTLCKLGEGAFATVYKVLRKEDNQQYAMKKINIGSLDQKGRKNCLNEVRILASIDNEFVVSYKDSFFDEQTDTFCIVTEYLEGGDVQRLVANHRNLKRQINEETIWKYAAHLLNGIKALHNLNIFHRDIKTANIFLNRNKEIAKLGDMNISIVTQDGVAKTQTGTPYYASPEVWSDKPYGSKCDIWSLGCVLYEMANLKPPFGGEDLRSLKRAIVLGNYKRIPANYSEDLEQFIRLCLKVNPKERLSAQELLETSFMKKRINTTLTNQAQNLNPNIPLLLQQIVLPPLKNFKKIEQQLPKHKFNRDSLNIENISCVYTGNRDENFFKQNRSARYAKLPEVKRSVSEYKKENVKIKYISEKTVLLEQTKKKIMPR